MADGNVNRKPIAVLSADLSGDASLLTDSDSEAVKTLDAYRRVFSFQISRHDGRVINHPGTNLLAAFANAIDALAAAVDIQKELARRNLQLAEAKRLQFRIGTHSGEVVWAGDDTFNDEFFSVLACIENLADPGGVCVSEAMYLQVNGKIDTELERMVANSARSVSEPVKAYRVAVGELKSKSSSVAIHVATLLVFSAIVAMILTVIIYREYSESREQSSLNNTSLISSCDEDMHLRIREGIDNNAHCLPPTSDSPTKNRFRAG